MTAGVTPRSVFLQWALLSREGERVLTDLAAQTRINTIELSNFDLQWGETRDGATATSPAPLALPADADFGGLPVPTTDSTRFRALAERIELVHDRGFQVACNLAPLYVSPPELARLSCIDVAGERVPAIHPQLAVYACPNNPEATAYGRAMARAFVEGWPRLDVLTVNHVEYPFWPQASVRELFVCFCEWCDAGAARSGIDLERVRQEILDVFNALTHAPRDGSPADALTAVLDRPVVHEWLRFRSSSMTAYVREVVEEARQAAAARGIELRLGLEFQLPTLAPFVGTDFEELSPLFDWASPKFPDYLGAAVIPIVAAELARGATDEDESTLRRSLRDALRLGPGPDAYEPAAEPGEAILYSNTFDLSVVRLQRPLLDPLVGRTPLHPYVWLYGHDLGGLEDKLAALRAEGFDGFFLWCWDRDLTSESIEALADVL